MTARFVFASLCLASLSVSAEAQVGPDYERPATVAPPKFKNLNVTWREASPSSHLSKGEWWKIFRDPKLNELEARATANNQQLKAAIARFDQARTTARMSKSNLAPVLGLPLSAESQRTSENAPSPIPLDGLFYKGPVYNAMGDFNWELDLWGKLRRAVEADLASTEAAADEVHNVLLGIQAEVASTYFQIHALDAEIKIVREAVGLRGEAFKIAKARVDAGAGSDLELAQSETEVATAEAEISALQARRDQLENVLAILVGEAASSFRVPTNGVSLPTPPKLPTGVPTDLLERRPDISAAERQLAAATARIGVARAQFFPSVRLAGSGGYQSSDLDLLFDPASLIWSYGPKVSVPVFSGGKNRFNLSRSHAAHDEALANYRQAFLAAIADVETSMSTLRNLQSQAAAQQRARASAEKASSLARTMYDTGTSPYLDVIDANRTTLQTQRATIQIAGQRLMATVSLVKAIGGGWDRAEKAPLPAVAPDPAAKSNPEVTEKGFLKRMFQNKR